MVNKPRNTTNTSHNIPNIINKTIINIIIAANAPKNDVLCLALIINRLNKRETILPTQAGRKKPNTKDITAEIKIIIKPVRKTGPNFVFSPFTALIPIFKANVSKTITITKIKTTIKITIPKLPKARISSKRSSIIVN